MFSFKAHLNILLIVEVKILFHISLPSSTVLTIEHRTINTSWIHSQHVLNTCILFDFCPFIDPHLTIQHLKMGDCFKTSHLLRHACLTDYCSVLRHDMFIMLWVLLAPWTCLAIGFTTFITCHSSILWRNIVINNNKYIIVCMLMGSTIKV